MSVHWYVYINILSILTYIYMYIYSHFLHDRPWISPWIKSISNELDITIIMITLQLFRYCDVISNRLWRHQQKEDTGTVCKYRRFYRHLWIRYVVTKLVKSHSLLKTSNNGGSATVLRRVRVVETYNRGQQMSGPPFRIPPATAPHKWKRVFNSADIMWRLVNSAYNKLRLQKWKLHMQFE